MPQLFHLMIETTDCLGRHPKFETTVIAADEQEARDELAEYFSMHDEIESWRIAQTIEVSAVPADSPFARDYTDKGAHSYITQP
ncbi:MAG: hypothetical protein HZA89_16275 [Verrucomicrobia bacterium]|nr:hypothetical protein [Verrucomicrobiota bacterium]